MSVAFLLSASSRVCRHHGSSPESQKACYKRISQSITDHRSQKERKRERETTRKNRSQRERREGEGERERERERHKRRKRQRQNDTSSNTMTIPSKLHYPPSILTTRYITSLACGSYPLTPPARQSTIKPKPYILALSHDTKSTNKKRTNGARKERGEKLQNAPEKGKETRSKT